MANSISGINGIYGTSGLYGVYGVNSYKNYLASLKGNQSYTVASMLNAAVKNSANTSSSQSGNASYLTQLNQSLYSNYYLNSMYSTMSAKTAVATNSNVVTATAQQNASVQAYSLKVTSLAAKQINTGTAITAGDKTTIQQGLNIFKVRSGNSEKNISVAISNSDTNKTALSKLASAINYSDVGIKASVTTGSDNKVSLSLESIKSGTKNAFSLTDLQGTAISSTGIGTVTTKAQNAAYSVDGKPYTSSSNTIALDSGKVQATLKNTGNSTLEVVPDTTNSSLPDYYSYFNNMLSSGNYYSRLLGSSMFDMFL